jgi:hypothetical protein
MDENGYEFRRMQEQLRDAQRQIEFLSGNLIERDLAANAARKPAYLVQIEEQMAAASLKRAQDQAAHDLNDPTFAEILEGGRKDAYPFKLWDHEPGYYKKGVWPEGMSAEIYCRRFAGLNDEGTALLPKADEPIVEPEPEKLPDEVEAVIQRMFEGKT